MGETSTSTTTSKGAVTHDVGAPVAAASSPPRPYKPQYKIVHEPEITWFAAITTYFNYIVLILFGRVRDFLGR